jgi:hypothetical protein
MKYVVVKRSKRAVDLQPGDYFILNDWAKDESGASIPVRAVDVRMRTRSTVEIGWTSRDAASNTARSFVTVPKDRVFQLGSR